MHVMFTSCYHYLLLYFFLIFLPTPCWNQTISYFSLYKNDFIAILPLSPLTFPYNKTSNKTLQLLKWDSMSKQTGIWSWRPFLSFHWLLICISNNNFEVKILACSLRVWSTAYRTIVILWIKLSYLLRKKAVMKDK